MSQAIHAKGNVIKAAKSTKPKFSTRLTKELSCNKYLYILAVPVILYYLIFCYVPMFGMVIVFKNFEIVKGVWASKWVGLKNFRDYFNGIYFTRTLKNTFAISIGSLAFGFPAPIIFALLLNELSMQRFKKFVQTSTYLPHFISMVVMCGMIIDFFGTDGVISSLISFFGGANMNYLGQPEYFRSIFIATGIWQGIGWGSIIYLAALAGVDTELYEAATIDGAGRFKRMLHVTLPGIAPTILVMLILRMGHLLSVGYEKVILLYSPATYEVGDVISSYVYRMGINNARYSYSAAVGMFQAIVNVTLVLSANALSKKISSMSLF